MPVCKDVSEVLLTDLFENVIVSNDIDIQLVNELMEPWSSDLNDQEAPEEAESSSPSPSPSSFDVPLTYMNKTIAEATLDFHQMIETRVSVALRDSTYMLLKD